MRSPRRSGTVRSTGSRVSGALALLLACLGCLGPPSIGDDPEIAADELDRGRALYRRGDYAAALDPLLRACAATKPCGAALPMLTECLLNTRQPENGVDVLAEVIERHPALEAEARGYRADLLDDSLELAEAEAEYRRSLALEATVRVHVRLGNMLLRLDRADEAVAVYRDGLRVGPDDRELRFRLARALRAVEQYDEAKVLLERLLREDPSWGRAWSELGRVYLAHGEDEAAVTSFRQAIAADPDNVEARFMLGRLALREGKYKAAELRLKEIERIESTLGRGRDPDP